MNKLKTVYQIAKELDLLQVNDPNVIEEWIDEAMNDEKLINFICGKVIKISKQKANTILTKQLVINRLKRNK